MANGVPRLPSKVAGKSARFGQEASDLQRLGLIVAALPSARELRLPQRPASHFAEWLVYGSSQTWHCEQDCPGVSEHA